MYDVAIIGLGPAGAILAKHLPPTLKTIAIDKKSTTTAEGFQKPCGGLLAPDAQKSLARFGITLPLHLLVDPQIFSVRTVDLKTGLNQHYQRHYINFDRHAFDQWLISLIPPFVEIHAEASVTQVEKLQNGYRLCYQDEAGQHSITARYVVGADGANSLLRRRLYPQFRIHADIAIQQWFADVHETPFYSCVFDPALTDSYAWGLTKNGYFIFGGAFSLQQGRARFEQLKEKLAQHGFQLRDPIKTEACLVLRPKGWNNFCLGSDGAFLIGEAAGFISPSSLEGISYALDSGYLLAQCLSRKDADANKAYRRGAAKICRKLFLKQLKRPFLYQPLLRKLVMKSKLKTVKMIAATVAEDTCP